MICHVHRYLKDVEEGGGGATWFPQASNLTTGGVEAADMGEVYGYYENWNNKAMRQKIDPPQKQFGSKGFRVHPKRGAAIMWPNANFDNIYEQHPATIHAAGVFP